jgi:site-specific recombinase XerD
MPPSASLLSAVLGRIEKARDRALVALLIGSGLQVGEALTLRLGDVSPGARFVTVRGPHQRTVAVSETARPWVLEYVRSRNSRPSEPLFVTKRGGRLSYAGAHRVFRVYAAGSGLTMRHLRMNAAADAFGRGASLAQVQHMLGHRHAASTARYQVSTEHNITKRRSAPQSKEKKHG